MQSITSYLQRGQLADVLALIQVLAYDRDTSRSESGLKDEFQRDPVTAGSWIALAQQHPEFFRVRNHPDKTQRVALVSRYVRDYQETSDGDEKRPPLEPDITNKLMELAIQLHDKQVERKHRWKSVVLPMAVALIAAGAAIGGAIISASKFVSPPAQQGAAGDVQPATRSGRP